MSGNKRKFSELSRKQQQRIVQQQIDEEEYGEDIVGSSSSDEQSTVSSEASPVNNLGSHQSMASNIDEGQHPNVPHVSSVHSAISYNEGALPLLNQGDAIEPVSMDIDSESRHEALDTDDESDVVLFSDEDELESGSGEEGHDITPQLRDFCSVHLPADSAVNQLLNILRNNPNLQGLPRNHNELYNTPTTQMEEPVNIGGGKYLHFGIKANLKYIEIDDPEITSLTLNFSWDGVRLFKSSNKALWPIVMHVEELPHLDVLLVGLFIGDTKPSNPNEFFHCFNEETKEIENNDFIVNVGVANKNVTVRSDFCIADVPAKTWALCKFLTFLHKVFN